MTNAAILLDELWASRAGRHALRGVSLAVRAGEVVGVIGPSGAGKSTLLRVVLGLLAPDRGRVVLHGVVASDGGRILVAPEDRELGMVFQDLALWPHLTVRGNLAFGLDARGVPRPERERRIDEVLRRVSLGDERDRYPDSLSGGERQRVAIARALVLDPAAVLLDEPLASLDVLLRQQLRDLLRELFAERRPAVLYVTHDPRELQGLAQRIVVLDDGTVVQDGTPAELRAQPRNELVRRLVEAW
ncbi:MAG: ABC transporter ATP-binding protein [Thermodesulfobacteriota bacterium]